MRSSILIEPGLVFGRLTIVSEAAPILTSSIAHKQHSAWNCLCECGKTTIAQSRRLREGTKRSCGCLQNDTLVKNSYKHGLHHTGGYKAWNEMMKRCYRPNNISYHNYGGRGIAVVPEWHNLHKFIEDMGHPERGMSLDRLDSNKDYSKENCRWADRLTQNNNKRNVRLLEFRGETHSYADWARIAGIKHATLVAKMEKWGWSLERSLTEPVK